MREILFRGKRTDNGEWAYGSYCQEEMFNHGGTEYFIIEYSYDGAQYEVIPKTVSQYTGLTDKNGKEIFEGDIIHVTSLNSNGNFVVKFNYGQFYIGINMPIAYIRNSCEVLGNIYDNQELLKTE